MDEGEIKHDCNSESMKPMENMGMLFLTFLRPPVMFLMSSELDSRYVV